MRVEMQHPNSLIFAVESDSQMDPISFTVSRAAITLTDHAANITGATRGGDSLGGHIARGFPSIEADIVFV